MLLARRPTGVRVRDVRVRVRVVRVKVSSPIIRVVGLGFRVSVRVTVRVT